MGNVMHRGKGSFTHVENTVFFDRSLSLKAKGIYCQIRSLEGNPEWVFTIRGFASLVRDGVDAVTAGIKELEEAGYIIRARKRSENGRFLKAEEATWITLDDPAMHGAVSEELRAEGFAVLSEFSRSAAQAAGEAGAEVSVERLGEMCLELQEQGALNVNFVTPTHYAPEARAAVAWARERGLALPVVWNTSGYETVAAVRANAGTVDAYLADFKYADAELARRYSHAPDYPEVALAALEAMVEEAGGPTFDEVDGEQRLTGGVVVRHLMLPGALEDSKRVVRLVHERFGDAVLLSLMNQYTPVLADAAKAGDARAAATLDRCPELAERVSDDEYELLLDYADELGVEDYFWQQGGAAEDSFIPAFDLSGVREPDRA